MRAVSLFALLAACGGSAVPVQQEQSICERYTPQYSCWVDHPVQDGTGVHPGAPGILVFSPATGWVCVPDPHPECPHLEGRP